MRAFSHNSLSIAVVRSSDAIQLHFRGRSNERHPGRTLGLYLAQAVDAAADTASLLELRFEGLSYFNSATVSTIIQCLQAARARAVNVRLVYDADLEWQRLSFEPMRVFATDSLLELSPITALEPPRLKAEGT